MTLIYSVNDHPRLRYTLDLIFNQILTGGYTLTDKVEEFSNYAGAKIWYAPNPPEGALSFMPSGLLHEEGIRKQRLRWEHLKDMPRLHIGSSGRFDLFASVFFLLSRYEEYIVEKRDRHDRFRLSDSILFANRNYRLPLVNIWVKALGRQLGKGADTRRFEGIKTESSFDLDFPWKYRYYGWSKHLKGAIRDVLRLKPHHLFKRIGVVLDRVADPFERLDWMVERSLSAGVKPLLFVPVSKSKIYFDRNRNLDMPEYRALIKALLSSVDIGLHPGYTAYCSVAKIFEEKHELQQIVGEVYRSRMHFLRLRLPDSYRALLGAGITEDYSMGYAEDIGFRAGISTPFYWYDLEREQTTGLLVHPFCIMDQSLKRYLKLDAERAIGYITQIKREIAQSGGVFSFIWHNSSFDGDEGWTGYDKVFENLLISN